MKWSETTWYKAQSIYKKITELSFIRELMEGTLPQEKFQFYIEQDSWYLEHFGRALALIGARAYEAEDTLAFIRFAEGAIVVENALHDSYFKEFKVVKRGNIEPACHHYIHYLKSSASLESVEVAMAAILPCFWIYKEVGDFIYKNQTSSSNPYRKWIETYAGDDFEKLVVRAVEICDRAALRSTSVQKESMTSAFITSSLLELDFWESAYSFRKW